MAEKRRLLSQDATWRENIRTGHILNQLQKHIDGELDLTPTKVKAAEILLKKTIPDVQQITIDVSGGLTVEVLQVASHKPAAKRKVQPAPKPADHARNKAAGK